MLHVLLVAPEHVSREEWQASHVSVIVLAKARGPHATRFPHNNPSRNFPKGPEAQSVDVGPTDSYVTPVERMRRFVQTVGVVCGPWQADVY